MAAAFRLIVLTTLTVLAGSAHARPVDARAVEVKQHYEAGLAAFNLQDYDHAVVEFEAAYRLRPDPVFLYNLAQAHRRAGRHERALYFYRTYLRAGSDPPNRGEVETRIQTLEKLIQEQANAKKPPDSTIPPPESKPAVEPTLAETQSAPSPQPAPVATQSRPPSESTRSAPVYKTIDLAFDRERDVDWALLAAYV
jgi:tetratricopeptide (TPR) repeat protein